MNINIQTIKLIVFSLLIGALVITSALLYKTQNNLLEQKTQYEQVLSNLDEEKAVNGTLILDKRTWIKQKDSLYHKIDSLTNIKPKTITRIVEVKSETVIRDSVITKDTIIVRRLDTLLTSPHYRINLLLEPPNKAELGIQIPTDIQVITSRRKVPQKGFFWWFKRRLVVEDNTVTTSNPYIQINDTKFIELK